MPPVRRWGLNYHNFVLFKKRIIFGGNATILFTVVMWDQLVPTTATRYTCSDTLRFRHIFFAARMLFSVCKIDFLFQFANANVPGVLSQRVWMKTPFWYSWVMDLFTYKKHVDIHSDNKNKRKIPNIFTLAWWNKYQEDFLFDMEDAIAQSYQYSPCCYTLWKGFSKT